MHALYFEPDTTKLIEGYDLILEDVARQMLEFPSLQVLARAYAAHAGTAEHRHNVSVSRSWFIRDYLVRNFGIATSQLSIEAYGSDRILDHPEDDWEINRCAELILFSE